MDAVHMASVRKNITEARRVVMKILREHLSKADDPEAGMTTRQIYQIATKDYQKPPESFVEINYGRPVRIREKGNREDVSASV